MPSLTRAPKEQTSPKIQARGEAGKVSEGPLVKTPTGWGPNPQWEPKDDDCGGGRSLIEIYPDASYRLNNNIGTDADREVYLEFLHDIGVLQDFKKGPDYT
ncbi:MAG: hypothetical protein M1160_03095 [Candidatus Marsarchaeota archaeon]|jgi:hypothetical protein|nr:hypothetical protein [Candidatus Marsarchaeota archaeon]MCL5111837.1 hypothetical protein [Candidatus Marsarchaeota archaeon]